MALATEAARKYMATAWPERKEAETRYNALKQVYWQLRLVWQHLSVLGRLSAEAGVPMPCAYLPESSIREARQAAQAALDALNAIDERINKACGTDDIGAARERTVPAQSPELEQSLGAPR
jgi:hypothetical protein